MDEIVAAVIGIGFLVVFAFALLGAGLGEFLERRREQKFRHEREMARIAAGRDRSRKDADPSP